jgi:type VI secretion system secreted protein VgrG
MGGTTFADATDELRALFDGPQYKRLLLIDFPKADTPALFLINQLLAREAISRSFRYEVEVMSDDVRIPLESVMGKMVTVSLVREDDSVRYFNGYVTEFRFVKMASGFAFYSMVLEPWLAFLRLRQDCAIFHDQSVLDITEATFARYAERDWRHQLFDACPTIACAIQPGETDYNHLHRRWEALGLHYWYEHREDGHTLWLGDNTSLAAPVDGGPDPSAPQRIRFRQNSSNTPEEDGIDEWQAMRRLRDHNASRQYFEAKGSARMAQPGRSFMLGGIAHGEYLVLSATHRAGNNYHVLGGAPSEHENSLICMRKSVQWRPRPGFNSVQTTIQGLQTATVVALPDQHDAGQAKVRFHWDRAATDLHTAWVPFEGTAPLVGQEVIVQFLDGNADRPVILGQGQHDASGSSTME